MLLHFQTSVKANIAVVSPNFRIEGHKLFPSFTLPYVITYFSLDYFIFFNNFDITFLNVFILTHIVKSIAILIVYRTI